MTKTPGIPTHRMDNVGNHLCRMEIFTVVTTLTLCLRTTGSWDHFEDTPLHYITALFLSSRVTDFVQ